MAIVARRRFAGRVVLRAPESPARSAMPRHAATVFERGRLFLRHDAMLFICCSADARLSPISITLCLHVQRRVRTAFIGSRRGGSANR